VLEYNTFRAISACDTTAAVALLLPSADDAVELVALLPPAAVAPLSLLPLLLCLPPGLTGLFEAVLPLSPLLLLPLLEASLPLWFPALAEALLLACAAINWCW
jgi:hypothetical protein